MSIAGLGGSRPAAGDRSAFETFVDGKLDADSRRRVETHLGDCDNCERFGGEYGDAVRRIRAELADPTSVDAAVGARLLERLRGEA